MRRLMLGLLLVVFAAGLVAYGLFRRDIGAEKARLAGHSQTVETSFGRVEYAEAGSGDPIIGIHGTGGGFDQGLEMGAPLAKIHRLIAPSRFGYLGSDMPDGATVAMQADAIDEMMGSLGVDRAYIFGGSAGALSAMQLAIRHPERCRALVLLVPAVYVPNTTTGAAVSVSPVVEAVMKTVLGSDFIFWLGVKLMPDQMTRLLLATDPAEVHAAAPAEQERARSILNHILPVSIRAKGLMFDMRTAGAPEAMDLDRISCPVLAVSVHDDLFGTAKGAEYTAANVPDGRVVIFPDGGHVWVGHQDEVWKTIADFFARHEAAAP